MQLKVFRFPEQTKPLIKKAKLVLRTLRTELTQNVSKPRTIAASAAFGVFFGILPIWGFQIIAALFFAQLFRLNKVIVFLFTNISFPPLAPLIIYASYLTGGVFISGQEDIALASFYDLSILSELAGRYYLGGVVLAFAGLSGIYLIANIAFEGRKYFLNKSS